MSTVPDFEEPYPGWAQENKGPLILGVTGTLTFIALLFVTGRIYSRMISLGKLGSDDYIVILCIVSLVQRCTDSYLSIQSLTSHLSSS